MADDIDPSSDRRVTDDIGPVREWAGKKGAVPVRTEREQGTSDAVALVPEDAAEGEEYERLRWSAFDESLENADRVVVYDGSGDPAGLSVVDAASVDPDAVTDADERDRGSGERTGESTDYGEREMRGVGGSAAMTDDDHGDEAVRETRPDRKEPGTKGLLMEDVGKTVVDEEGTELGIVAQASGDDGAVHVDVDPGLTERVLSKLGWTGQADVDYSIPNERIVRVTDDEVVLRSDDVDTAGE